MRGLFVARAEPEYDYARAPHFQQDPFLDIPYSPLNDPPRDSDFATSPMVNGQQSHPAARMPITFYQSIPQWGPMGTMGMDDFIDNHIGHPLQRQGGGQVPYGYQTPWNERFNNSGLAQPTTSYNTIIDKIVAGIKARRGR